MMANQPRTRSKRTVEEPSAQALESNCTEIAGRLAIDSAPTTRQGWPTGEEVGRFLSEHDRKLHKGRGWAIKGAVLAFYAVKGTLLAIAPHLVADHRWTHKRHAPERCSRDCALRDLWLYCYLCAAAICAPRAMPSLFRSWALIP